MQAEEQPDCVPTADCVSVASDRHVWVNETPLHTVEGAGFHPPGQTHIGLVLSVPVAGRVSEALFEQVCVKDVPSHTVLGAGSHVPVQVVHSVGSVPTAGRVTSGSLEQVCVKLSPRHTVDGAGSQVPVQVGGGVLEHPALVSVPVAGRVLLSQRLVWVYETPSQIVEGAGPQCAAKLPKQLGWPQRRPATSVPVASGGHASAHSHASWSQGHAPAPSSSIHQSPSRFWCSPLLAAM